MDETVVVLAETNLGTCLAVSVHPDITTSKLTAKIEKEHFSCFNDIGKIKIQSLMIKKGSHLYSLSHEAVVRCFFKDLTNIWSLHVNAIPLSTREKDSYLPQVSILQDVSGILIAKEKNSNRKKLNMKGFHKRKGEEDVVRPSRLKFGKIEIGKMSSGKFSNSKIGIGERLVRAANSLSPCCKMVKLSRFMLACNKEYATCLKAFSFE